MSVFRRPTIILAAFLLLFTLGRMALWLVFPDDFSDLGGAQIIHAFLRGILFDASVIFTFAGLPLLLMSLPFSWSQSRWWQGIWGWLCFILFIAAAMLIASDIIYFGVVHRHVGPELSALAKDMDLIVAMATGSYKPALIGYLMFVVASFLLWRRVLSTSPVTKPKRVPVLGIVLCAIPLMGLSIRGGTGGKPLNIVNAFDSPSPAVGYLALNGPFSMYHSLRHSRSIDVNYLPWDEAVGITQKAVLRPEEKPLSNDYPLLRSAATARGKHWNVIVLMLESWDAAHVDALRKRENLEPLGATPRFDQLTREGVLFDHFYASGQRSMDGMSAMLAGIPTLPGLPYIGRGMEQSELGFLGHLATQEGYQTYFLQSAKRSSFRVDAIARRAGFDHYYGAEDIPATGHTDRTTERGAWDYDTLQYAHRLFAAARQPFIGFIFTASTHRPYQLPGEQWHKYPGSDQESQYLNTLYYADWALGEFFTAAKNAGYFNNTIFIITGDHVSGHRTRANDVESLHHLPCLVIAPQLVPSITTRIGSQLDIIPTIVDLAGWNVPYAALGRSLFDATSVGKRAAFAVRGNIIELINQQGWLAHNLTRRLNSHFPGDPDAVDSAERELLAMTQVAETLMLRNRVYPGARLLPDAVVQAQPAQHFTASH